MAFGAVPLGTTITFTGRSSATEVVNGLATFSTSMVWRETARFYARDDLAPEGFHVAFTTVAGTGTATILPRPDDPSGYKLPICAGSPVELVPITQRFSSLEVTSPSRPSRVQIKQNGIGAARGYDSIGLTSYLPSGQSDDLSGLPKPGAVEAFEFCHQTSPIPPWPVYAHFRTRKGVYRYSAEFADQSGTCPSPTDAGTHFTSTWTGRMTVAFGRRVAGRLQLPIGRTTLVEPPAGRSVPQLGQFDAVGRYRPKAGSVNQFTCPYGSPPAA